MITRPDHPLVKYAEAFTHNFDLIAERKSSVYHLRELAKASTMAKYLLDAQIDLEDSWLNLTQEVKGLYHREIPQLWNQQTSSQVNVQDGRILDAEKGMATATRGVYGGVQFGLDKFDLGATTMQPGAAEAPYALLFSGVDRGSVMARGVVTPPSLVEPRGVDLNLDKFNLAETKASEDLTTADFAFGSAFWSQIRSDSPSVFRDQDKALFRDLFNPKLSDRHDEGERFVPPNMRASYVAELRSLILEERDLQQKRKDEFFSKDFTVGNTASFPSSWANSFNVSQEGASVGDLQKHKLDKDGIDQVLKSATPCLDKNTEDGSRYRIYKADGLEIRTVQVHDGKEIAGAVFTRCVAPTDLTSEIQHLEETIVKATEYVEANQGESRHYYVVLQTEQGNRIVTERLQDGTVAWAANPRHLEARSSAAKVLRSTECTSQAMMVRDLKDCKVAEAGACASKHYARESFRRAARVQSA